MKPFWLPFGLKPKEEPIDEGPRYADLYERGLAAAIDITLLFLLLNRFFTYLSQRLYARADRDGLLAAQQAPSSVEAWHHLVMAGLPQLWLLNAALQLLIIGLFVLGCQLTWNTTPGKWLLGLSIRHREDLAMPARWRYVVRYLAYIPGALLFFVISFHKQRRGIHDMLAGTVVIHTRPKGWYWAQVKRGWRKLRGKSDSPFAVEQPVGEPTPGERHQDRHDPV